MNGYTLTDHAGHTLLKADGTPFTYSTAELAAAGRRILASARKIPVRIVPPTS